MVNHPHRSGHYVPIGLDNRGSKDCPFGFIYLGTSINSKNDVGRVGFGATHDNLNPLAIWPTRDTPANISPLATDRIRRFLASNFPHLVKGDLGMTKPYEMLKRYAVQHVNSEGKWEWLSSAMPLSEALLWQQRCEYEMGFPARVKET